MAEVCAWCEESRGAGSTCGKCGADYEKAAQIKSGNAPKPKARASKRVGKKAVLEARFAKAWQPVKDVDAEYKICLAAVPSMLAFSFLLEVVGIGDGLLRIVFGMPVHEMGHAVAGWFTGFNSIPTLWITLVPSERGWVAPILVFAGIVYLLNFARLHAYGGLLLLGLALLLLQFIGTVVLDKGPAGVLITWAGDGLGIMLATVLMIGFTFDKQTNWYKGYLRWGFAFIGAAAFADMVTPWWVSLNDVSAVPYGASGGTHTDTYKLVVYHGWDMHDVIHRYVYLSVICMVVLAVFYVRGIQQAARAVALRQKAASDEAGEGER